MSEIFSTQVCIRFGVFLFIFKKLSFVVSTTMSGEGFGSVTMWGFTPSIDLQAGKLTCFFFFLIFNRLEKAKLKKVCKSSVFAPGLVRITAE